MEKQLNIESHYIGNRRPAFIIAEVAQAHEGSLGMAHAYIDAAAEVGVDAVKFQTHIADAESTMDEPFRAKFSQQDESRFDYWKRMEFTFEQWQGLAAHAREKNLVFMSSPFSARAVEMLEKLDVPVWKIGSGETVSSDIMNSILATRKPVLASTGMSTYQEIDELVGKFRSKQTPFALFQCTSKYPANLSEVGLNVIQEMKTRYACPVGLSDHSGTAFPALAALAMGADLVEAHIVLDKRMFGPDTAASLTVEDFKLLTGAKKAFYEMTKSPVDKDEVAASMSEMRKLFGKSLAVTQDLPAGTVLTNSLITVKKPGTGISSEYRGEVVGKTLIRDVFRNRLLRWDDVSE